MDRECPSTMSGRHMFTPKQYGKTPATAKERLLCACGESPPDLKAAKADLKAVSRYRQKLARESERFITKLRKEHAAAGVQPKLPL